MIIYRTSSIIEARTLADVLPALRAVEAAAQAGFWAQGFVVYEAAPAFDPAFVVREPVIGLPLVWFALSDAPPSEEVIPPSDAPLPEFVSDMSPTEWARAITGVHERIGRGETYQVNLTRRLRSPWPDSLDACAVYERLRRTQSGTPYAIFFDTGRFQILSVSPELFFAREGDRLRTRPMKGTARRGRWFEEDERNAVALTYSEKERAENVMIVDLLRNDLGRIALPGTVQVESLFRVERYPTALQMTSTITAQPRSGVGLTEIFAALFPCGSVTGAPKIQTMQHIATLEKSARGVYCGAAGVVRPGGDAVFNVAIRTLVVDRERRIAEYGVGGGIVWDSTAEREWRETETKAAILRAVPRPTFDLLETMRLEDGVYWFYDRHLSRLDASAAYFERPCNRDEIERILADLARAYSGGRWRVRLRVDSQGRPSVEIHSLMGAFLRVQDCQAATPGFRYPVARAAAPVSRDDIFLCHKTTNRIVYEQARRAVGFDQSALFDVLLWNEEGEATEFTIGNLVAEIGGELWTPPRDCGLLNGVYREELLSCGEIRERVLPLSEVQNAARLFLINSVRGAKPVHLDEPVHGG